MKKLALILLLVPFLSASTCVDQATGIRVKKDAQGQPVKDAQGNIVYESIPQGGWLDVVGSLVPWGGAASAALSALWLGIRNRSLSGAVTAAVSGVQAIKANLKPEEIEAMAAAQHKASAAGKELLRSVAHKIEGKKG